MIPIDCKITNFLLYLYLAYVIMYVRFLQIRLHFTKPRIASTQLASTHAAVWMQTKKVHLDLESYWRLQDYL